MTEIDLCTLGRLLNLGARGVALGTAVSVGQLVGAPL